MKPKTQVHGKMRLIDTLPPVQGSYRENADLSKTNWFGVGGPADILFRPADSADLAQFLKHKPAQLPVTVIGVGSNLLVRDGGIEGVVVKLGRGFASVTREGDTIHAGTAALSFNTAQFCQHTGLGGLEFLSGIPGTIGGALAMNAGAYGNDTASCLLRAEALDEQGNLHILEPQDIGFVYRGNTLPEGWIFTKAVFKATPEDPAVIKARIDEITAKREATQPIRNRTSGSTFANPSGARAWELIDAAGCRGLRKGDAVISEKHCNFMINEGHASAEELEALGEEVRERVKATSGITLEWEVKRIGRRKAD